MKKIKLLIFILIAVSVTLEAANVYLSNAIATNSLDVTRLQQKIDSLDHDNNVLKADILENTSYEEISSKAAVLGFHEAKGTDTILQFTPPQVAFNSKN